MANQKPHGQNYHLKLYLFGAVPYFSGLVTIIDNGIPDCKQHDGDVRHRVGALKPDQRRPLQC